MATESQPNFILRGIRGFAEKTLPWAILGVGIGLFIPKVLGLALGTTAFDIATTSLIAKSRVPYAAA